MRTHNTKRQNHNIRCSRVAGRNHRYIRATTDVDAEIIDIMESVGMEHTEETFYDLWLDFGFFVTYDSETHIAGVDWNPDGNATEIMSQRIDSINDANNFASKVYNWNEYDMTELLDLAFATLKGAKEASPWNWEIDTRDGLLHINLKEYTGDYTDYSDGETLECYDGYDYDNIYKLLEAADIIR